MLEGVGEETEGEVREIKVGVLKIVHKLLVSAESLPPGLCVLCYQCVEAVRKVYFLFLFFIFVFVFVFVFIYLLFIFILFLFLFFFLLVYISFFLSYSQNSTE